MSKETTRLRLCVGIPAYGGQITAHQARMWIEFGNTLGGSLERFELVSFDFFDVNGIDQARNLMLVRAIEAQADWLLMIDADTWVEPTKLDQQSGADAGFLLLRMISDGARNNAAVVVAPVMSRVVPGRDAPHPMAYRVGPTEASAIGAHVDSIKPYPIDLSSMRGLAEVDRAATAVFALNVEFAIAHRLIFKFDGTLSEDHYYCKRVREAEGKIFADTRIRTGHLSRQTPLYSTTND